MLSLCYRPVSPVSGLAPVGAMPTLNRPSAPAEAGTPPAPPQSPKRGSVLHADNEMIVLAEKSPRSDLRTGEDLPLDQQPPLKKQFVAPRRVGAGGASTGGASVEHAAAPRPAAGRPPLLRLDEARLSGISSQVLLPPTGLADLVSQMSPVNSPKNSPKHGRDARDGGIFVLFQSWKWFQSRSFVLGLVSRCLGNWGGHQVCDVDPVVDFMLRNIWNIR